ncbi:hypothetical protein [Kitasatospora sp. NPDC059571]|uniref:hypothetical protein n=1 Tax=Kitasatospora sp. NPDC059571 TaxID=3346871 RepID=UPI0036C046CD
MNLDRSLTAAAFLLTAATTLAGCSGTPSHSPSATRLPSASPSYAPAVPPGWIRDRVDGLTFAHPADLVPRPATERAQPSAAIELGGPVSAQVPISPGFFVFEQTSGYGSADAQAAVTISNYKARLGSDPSRPAVRPTVPGAETAIMLEFDFPYTDGHQPTPVASRQFEIYVQTPGAGPLYGIRFGGPATYLTPDLGERLVDTLRLTPAPATTAGKP